MSHDGFEGYDRWKTDSGREGEHDDRSPYQLVICERGHRRLVRDRSQPGICWSCKAIDYDNRKKEHANETDEQRGTSDDSTE